MEVTKKVTVPSQPEKVETVVDCYACDLCGQKTRFKDGNWHEDSNFGRDYIEIRREHGVVYPEGGDTTVRTFDLCPKCFEKKLVPWLQDQGACVRETNRDF